MSISLYNCYLSDTVLTWIRFKNTEKNLFY